ncbi:MAG: 2-oxoglutarate and iron-dependent oxygenase domain-containing protein [Rhodanobacteraceae bacterium]
MAPSIPTLDIRCYDDEPDAFAAELGGACRSFGFFCVRGHGIEQSLIRRAYVAFTRFFALPLETKLQYYLAGSGGARGYTPYGIETAKDATMPDLKEFWHIGRELDEGSRYACVMAPNLWPPEVPDFRAAGYALYQALDTLGTRLLRALAVHVGLPQQYFDDKTDCGNSILRAVHYPPIVDSEMASVRAAAHEDINLITLLIGASDKGLEVLTRDGEWLPITTGEDAIVVNVGDMLQRLTNHVYPSASHRVINSPGGGARRSRYAIPFFLHANPDFLIEVLPSCIDATHPNRYPTPISADEYLRERLREIRLL